MKKYLKSSFAINTKTIESHRYNEYEPIQNIKQSKRHNIMPIGKQGQIKDGPVNLKILQKYKAKQIEKQG